MAGLQKKCLPLGGSICIMTPAGAREEFQRAVRNSITRTAFGPRTWEGELIIYNLELAEEFSLQRKLGWYQRSFFKVEPAVGGAARSYLGLGSCRVSRSAEVQVRFFPSRRALAGTKGLTAAVAAAAPLSLSPPAVFYIYIYFHVRAAPSKVIRYQADNPISQSARFISVRLRTCAAWNIVAPPEKYNI